MGPILVVDDKAIFRDLISASLQQAGYKTACAASGREALAVVQSSVCPALILLDLSMPDLDGLAVLRKIREQKSASSIPVILLTAAADKQTIVQAAKLGVSGYVLKDKFSLVALLSRIGQVIGPPAKETSQVIAQAGGSAGGSIGAPAAGVGKPQAQPAGLPSDVPRSQAADVGKPPAMLAGLSSDDPRSQASDADATADALAKMLGVPRLLTRDQCLERAGKALQGKALSGVVAQVIQLAASPTSEMTQVADSISHDPMLTAKILRVANSAVYTTGRGAVMNIGDAIKKVGFSTVRNIAATVGVFDAMPAGGEDSFDPIRCWQHSFAVALLCERLAATGQKSGDGTIAYLIGLCHDLGEILFQTCFGVEYKQVLDVHARTNQPQAQLEEAMLGVSSSELILLTIRSLQLPDAIRLPIEAMRSNMPSKDRLCSIVCLADLYANGMQLASSRKSPLRSFSNAECERVLGSASGPEINRDKIRGEIFALTALLSKAGGSDSNKPLFARSSAKIWLAREAALSKLDPVEAALDSLGNVQVTNRLPTPEEVAGFKAVVINAQAAASRTLNAENISALKNACKNRLPVLWFVQETETPAAQTNPDLPRPTLMPVALEAVAELLAA